MVDDPYTFGKIAATNALSDIYAMGGEVKTALNIVCFPEKMDLNILGEIMRGGAEKVIEAGGTLAGGHSIADSDVKYGLSVTGIVNPNKIYTNNGAKPGDALILGICNGFQALVKSGLLPYGRLGLVTKESPTLFRNDINRHVSQIVSTRVATTNSPWLSSFSVGDIHSIAVSHGEGKFVVNEPLARELFENGQVAFQYVDAEGRVTAEAPYNPNGSYYAIEGIVSRDGQILGKMGHTERYGENLFKNIAGEKVQDIFTNAVNYFRKTK